MERAFQPGDPVLELASMNPQPSHLGDKTEPTDHEKHWLPRKEQAHLDAIVNGTTQGHYHLLIGEKGTGKSSMLLEAMRKVDGDGVSMFEAHADSEIFRIRLGKALDFEFHEEFVLSPPPEPVTDHSHVATLAACSVFAGLVIQLPYSTLRGHLTSSKRLP
jgi:hypothetical protein